MDEASGSDGDNEGLRDELKEVLPPSAGRGSNALRDSAGSKVKDVYTKEEARERDAYRDHDREMRKRIGVPNPNEPIFK